MHMLLVKGSDSLGGMEIEKCSAGNRWNKATSVELHVMVKKKAAACVGQETENLPLLSNNPWKGLEGDFPQNRGWGLQPFHLDVRG